MWVCQDELGLVSLGIVVLLLKAVEGGGIPCLSVTSSLSA